MAHTTCAARAIYPTLLARLEKFGLIERFTPLALRIRWQLTWQQTSAEVKGRRG